MLLNHPPTHSGPTSCPAWDNSGRHRQHPHIVGLMTATWMVWATNIVYTCCRDDRDWYTFWIFYNFVVPLMVDFQTTDSEISNLSFFTVTGLVSLGAVVLMIKLGEIIYQFCQNIQRRI
jgi:hypothetical protein